MNRKTVGILVLLVGLILVALSLSADFIGLSDNTVFGYKQIAGLVVGVGGIIVGVIFIARKLES